MFIGWMLCKNTHTRTETDCGKASGWREPVMTVWQDEAGLDAGHLCLDLAPGGEGSVLRHVLHVHTIGLHITKFPLFMMLIKVPYQCDKKMSLERVADLYLHYFGKLNPDSH
jgi:hypothetical protein